MTGNLPPPNWTPTGNSGTWVWQEKGEYDKTKKKWRSCYHWYDDVHGYDWKERLHKTMKGKKGGLLENKKKNWFQRLKDKLKQ